MSAASSTGASSATASSALARPYASVEEGMLELLDLALECFGPHADGRELLVQAFPVAPLPLPFVPMALLLQGSHRPAARLRRLRVVGRGLLAGEDTAQLQEERLSPLGYVLSVQAVQRAIG